MRIITYKIAICYALRNIFAFALNLSINLKILQHVSKQMHNMAIIFSNSLDDNFPQPLSKDFGHPYTIKHLTPARNYRIYTVAFLKGTETGALQVTQSLRI